MKEENRLKSLGDYSNITIKKLKKYVQWRECRFD
jgi:hypothetical protein